MAKTPSSQAFGQRIDINLSLQAYIETDCFDGVDYTHLRFDIKINKEHANQYEPIALFLIADGEHRGERAGTEWDALQLRWQKQLDYLKKHLFRAVAWSAVSLCGEAVITTRDDWNLKAILADAALDEIDEWSKRHAQENDKSGAWQFGERLRFQPHFFVSLYAQHIWNRLKGTEGDEKNITTPIGSFTEAQHHKVLERYPEFAQRWKDARSILRAHHPPDEKVRLLELASGPNIFWRFPDDLLDNLRETVRGEKAPHTYRLKYRPGQIALVHLARDAWLLNKDGSRLRAHQWQSIRRAINKYSSEHKKPKLRIQS